MAEEAYTNYTSNTVMGPGTNPIQVPHREGWTVEQYIKEAMNLQSSFNVKNIHECEVGVNSTPANLYDVVYEPGSIIDISARMINGNEQGFSIQICTYYDS